MQSQWGALFTTAIRTNLHSGIQLSISNRTYQLPEPTMHTFFNSEVESAITERGRLNSSWTLGTLRISEQEWPFNQATTRPPDLCHWRVNRTTDTMESPQYTVRIIVCSIVSPARVLTYVYTRRFQLLLTIPWWRFRFLLPGDFLFGRQQSHVICSAGGQRTRVEIHTKKEMPRWWR